MINELQSQWDGLPDSEKREIANFVSRKMQKTLTEGARIVLDYLNAALEKPQGGGFRQVASNHKHINGRLAQGFTIDEMKAVIDRKVLETKKGLYNPLWLRPSTLFNDEKFNQYIGQIDMKLPEAEKPKLKFPPMNDSNAWIALAKKCGAHNTASYDDIRRMASAAYDAGRLQI